MFLKFFHNRVFFVSFFRQLLLQAESKVMRGWLSVLLLAGILYSAKSAAFYDMLNDEGDNDEMENEGEAISIPFFTFKYNQS